MVQPVIHRFEDHEAMSRAAADRIAGVLGAAVRDRSMAAMALAGGSTPRRTYELLADEHAGDVDWSAVHVFWGDERCVPADDPSSNQHMARQALLDRVGVPEENVHPMDGTLPPDKAAQAYEDDVRSVLGPRAGAGEGTFDLVLLGLGGDGHTASLFPGDAALDETERWVAPATAPEGADVPERLTLTYPGIAEAERVWFLVSGASKRGPLGAILEGTPDAADLPASRITARRQVAWFVDDAAIGDDGSGAP